MIALSQYILKWDSLVLASLTGCCRRDQTIRAMRWLSRAADGQFYPVFLVLISILQDNRWRILAACFISFAFELAAYKLIKQAVKRPRPFQQLVGLVNLVAPKDVFSFPSGHTAGAFVVATIVCICYSQFLIPGYFWAALVGLSRIYLGVHYPSDVAAGACLGIISARTGFLAASWLIPQTIV
ncbi:MAG: phosphatase PAP2 family protein [Acidobacteria bacterium]|nr:phosphatase PAP2 family protein [Acidobacteriota bacterium]